MKADPKLATLGVLLQQGGERAVRSARQAMKRIADKIVKCAQDNAPVLQHDEGGARGVIHGPTLGSGGPGPLERSIQRVDGYEDNRRLQILIEAGEGLGEYPLIMEEALTPYGSGSLKLGPLSQAKRMSGKDVGGKYMERALDEYEKDLPNEIKAAVISELEDLS